MLHLFGGDWLLIVLDPRDASKLIETLVPTCVGWQQEVLEGRKERARLFSGSKHGFRDI